MAEDARQRSKRALQALAGVLLLALFIALATALWRAPRSGAPTVAPVTVADTAADEPVVRIRVVRLGGNSEAFHLAASGRVAHESEWESRELTLPPGNAERLERDLLACGVCTLEPAEPVPAGPSRRRIDVELPTQPATCSANLPWETWFEDEAAHRCLTAVQTALAPLRDQCEECTVP